VLVAVDRGLDDAEYEFSDGNTEIRGPLVEEGLVVFVERGIVDLDHGTGVKNGGRRLVPFDLGPASDARTHISGRMWESLLHEGRRTLAGRSEPTRTPQM
jgi:hypothetical protein